MFAIRNTTRTVAIAAGLVLTLGGTALGQSRQVPAPAQDHPIALRGGTVHTGDGTVIKGGYVVFDGGVITAVGRGAPPARRGLVEHDVKGMHVYPALVSADTKLGLQETGAVDVTHDHTETGDFKPEVRAAVAVNPDSDLIPVARANGILTAMVMPSGGRVSGRASFIRLDGWTWEDLAVDDAAGLVLTWPNTEPITASWMQQSASQQQKRIKDDLLAIDRYFDETEAYLAARRANPELRTDLRYEAMRPFVSGEKPLFIRAGSAAQIESAVTWCGQRDLKGVILSGTGAAHAIPVLKRYDVPVIVTGLHRLPPGRDAAYDEPFTVPLRLHEAGVRFCIASGAGAAHERNLNHNAATAAAYGLPPEAALAAVTRDAADILGVGETYGTIEKGKSATLIVTNGDPLEITTDTLIAYLDGRRVDLGNRQKTLYAKYREKYRQLGLLE